MEFYFVTIKRFLKSQNKAILITSLKKYNVDTEPFQNDLCP